MRDSQSRLRKNRLKNTAEADEGDTGSENSLEADNAPFGEYRVHEQAKKISCAILEFVKEFNIKAMYLSILALATIYFLSLIYFVSQNYISTDTAAKSILNTERDLLLLLLSILLTRYFSQSRG